MDITALFNSGLAGEPAASLWLLVSAALFVGVALSQPIQASGGSAWVWGSRFLASLARALLVIALALAVHFLILTDAATLKSVHGSFNVYDSQSNQNWRKWVQTFGSNVTQEDLQVTQSFETQKIVELTPVSPSQKTLYKNTVVVEPVQQNSITAFSGRVKIQYAGSFPPSDSFHGYNASASYQYEITNPVDQETRVTYRFPLFGSGKVVQQITITRDGKPFNGWLVDNNAIVWEDRLQPGQKRAVLISYSILGMDSFTYTIPQQRLITQFNFVLDLGDLDCCYYSNPENDAIRTRWGMYGGDRIITWTIDGSVMAPSLEFFMGQDWPYNPTLNIMSILPYAARAAILFISLLLMTWLICAVPPRLPLIALLGVLFMLPYLPIMAGGYPYPPMIAPAQWADWQIKMLLLFSLLPLLLSFFTLRRQLATLPFVLTLFLMALFMGGYSLIGLVPDESKRNAVESMLQALTILYVFILTVGVRLRHQVGAK